MDGVLKFLDESLNDIIIEIERCKERKEKKGKTERKKEEEIVSFKNFSFLQNKINSISMGECILGNFIRLITKVSNCIIAKLISRRYYIKTLNRK